MLRFPAALIVLLYHYFGAEIAALPGGRSLGALAIHGYLGVVFFFVLSGFILAHVHGNDLFGRDFGCPVRRRFYIARIARVGPVLWLSLLLGLPAFLKALSDGGRVDPWLEASAMVLAPLGLHAWVPGAACSLTCPTWSLSVEAFFYGLFPLVVAPVRAAPIRAIAVALLSGLALAGAGDWVWLWATGGVDPLLTYLPESRSGQLLRQAVLYNPLLHLPAFVCGVAGYTIWQTYQQSLRRSVVAALIGLLGLIVLCATADDLPPVLRSTVLPVPVFLLLIVASAQIPSRSAPLEWLGQISFALYAVHIPIYQIITSRTVMGPTLTAKLLATILSLIVAALVFRYLEGPGRRWVIQTFGTRTQH